MYLNSCKSAASFLATLLCAAAGLGLGLLSLPPTRHLASELTLSYS